MARPAYNRVLSLLCVSLLALVLPTCQAFLAPSPKTGVSSGLVVRCRGAIRDPAPPPSASRRRILVSPSPLRSLSLHLPASRPWASPPPASAHSSVRVQPMSMGMERDPERSGGMDRNGGEERPKAKKTPLVAAAPTHKPTLEEDLARSLASMGRTVKETLGAPVGEHWIGVPSCHVMSLYVALHVLSVHVP